jgi:hypothetical protein
MLQHLVDLVDLVDIFERVTWTVLDESNHFPIQEQETDSSGCCPYQTNSFHIRVERHILYMFSLSLADIPCYQVNPGMDLHDELSFSTPVSYTVCAILSTTYWACPLGLLNLDTSYAISIWCDTARYALSTLSSYLNSCEFIFSVRLGCFRISPR